ncbi:hypothetical protein BCT30_18835 [Enterovibrio norvegicus]|uniref:Uncharacterized protein n=2 Tax=Enterovibrio norvegicus TaxID=188144 RepID=A0A1I5LTG9_9GAMM|nr:hypothetical protein [Enterovibrio norvegicus]MCC4798506.1 hypothetical protein [Enterovibrio norvegicus]OEE43670.1 hypothetical protein A1OS_10270 [Enterovibrio norvegicus]OEF48922.1 hypothetical protein A1OW_13680 [Enterovibrio norvegicus]OEF57094.1 hypothetical protein A1OU_20335 [Enterovibrio norvegicus]PMH65477.1 hypothetical protein BCU62_12845 [Enterovibrio norvegicus]
MSSISTVPLLMCGIVALSGCQLIQQTRHEQIYDPTEIAAYQLPALLEGVETVKSFRQSRNDETWFWTQLENNTYLPGENYVVQIISRSPFKQPPNMFSFTVPEGDGQLVYNDIGPYQQWTETREGGERCLIARQSTRGDNFWLSVFTHYCTANEHQDLVWIHQLKPSLLLEGF